MRIWDISPVILCRQHLLGEHRELHAIWTVLTTGKKGYSQHPETKRWVGRLRALFLRHEALVTEMEKRGYVHKSPLDETLATGEDVQTLYIDAPEQQLRILRNKHCLCKTT